MNGVRKIILPILLLLAPKMLFGWGSTKFIADNHRPMTSAAIGDLGILEYPDLDQYRGSYPLVPGVVEDSADESSHSGQWDGPADTWKSDGVKKYVKFDFQTAYKYLGFYLHLKQDRWVPAHQRKCAHGIWFPPNRGLTIFSTDNLETFAADHPPAFYSVPVLISPLWYDWYQKGDYIADYWLDDDQDDDDDDEMPFDGGGYDDKNVQDGPNAYNITSTWGTYGGGDRLTDNMIPGNDKGEDWYDGEIQGSEIAYRQLYLAFLDTRAELKKFSEELPPLIRNFKIEPSVEGVPIIDPIAGSKITFEMLENRSML